MGATWRGGRGWGRMGWGSHVVVEGWEMAFKEDVWLPKRKVEVPQLEAVHESQKPRRREDGEACCNGWSQAEANEGKRRETAEVAAAAPPQLATAGLATAASQQPTSLPSLAAMAPTACTCPTAAAMAAVVCSNWVEALPRKASRKWWEVPLQGTSRRGPKEGEKERYRGGGRRGGRGGGRKWNYGGGGCRGRDRGGVEEKKGGGKRKGAKGRGGSAHPHRTSRAKGEGGGGGWAPSGGVAFCWWCRGRGGGGDPLHGMGWGQTQRGPPRTTLGKSHGEKEEKEEEKGCWGEALNKGFFTLNKGCFLPWTRAVFYPEQGLGGSRNETACMSTLWCAVPKRDCLHRVGAGIIWRFQVQHPKLTSYCLYKKNQLNWKDFLIQHFPFFLGGQFKLKHFFTKYVSSLGEPAQVEAFLH